MIDSDTCEYIRSRSDALCKLTGAQIVIAITRSLNGEPIDRYAERDFLDREIGDKDKDNGVLLLMAIEDGNYWLTKGSGLESTLPVSSLRTMLDSIFEPCFAAGEYSVGTKALFDALYGKLCALYGVNPSPTSGSSAMISGSTDTQTEAQGSERGILPYMLLAIIAAAIVTVVIFLFALCGLRQRTPVPRILMARRLRRAIPPLPARQISSERQKAYHSPPERRSEPTKDPSEPSAEEKKTVIQGPC